MDQESVDEKQLEGLRLAFRADGGRIGLQEGGGIMQRLNQLGSDVTSAEKLLQEINKRLESAESSWWRIRFNRSTIYWWYLLPMLEM